MVMSCELREHVDRNKEQAIADFAWKSATKIWCATQKLLMHTGILVGGTVFANEVTKKI